MSWNDSKPTGFENPIIMNHAQTGKTNWKRLARSKGKVHSLDVQIFGNKLAFVINDVNDSVFETGKKFVRIGSPSSFSMVEAAEQLRRSS